MTNSEAALACERTMNESVLLLEEMGLRGTERIAGLARMCGISHEVAGRWLRGQTLYGVGVQTRLEAARKWWTPEAITAEVHELPYVRRVPIIRGATADIAWAVCWPGGMVVCTREDKARAMVSDVAALEFALEVLA